jgi:hypothetical protein
MMSFVLIFTDFGIQAVIGGLSDGQVGLSERLQVSMGAEVSIAAVLRMLGVMGTARRVAAGARGDGEQDAAGQRESGAHGGRRAS